MAAGQINDPRPSNVFSYHMINMQAVFAVFTRNLKTADLMAWALALALISIYLWQRRSAIGDPRPRDTAFFSAVTLTIVYHRYYDAQLLLAAVPFVLNTFRSNEGTGHRTAIALSCCLLLLEFPLQAMMAPWSSSLPADRSLAGFLLFRHQPLTVLAICILLIPRSQAGILRVQRRPAGILSA